MELNALLGQPVALPSLPRTVALLMNELAQREPSLRRLNLLFGSDPVLAARLLELANAPAHQLTRQVAGISEALVLLGSAPLQTLVSSATLGTAARAVPGINLQQFWRYSLNTAKLARSFAGLVQQSQIVAYTAGLLHGVGELALHLGDPERMQSINTLVPPLDPRRAKLEQRLLELANAPAHQLTRQVAGISEALVLLGSAPLQTLVSSATLGTAARAVQGINLQQFWRYSLHTAKLARSLAGVVFQNPTAAYTAGLLHGLGELLIHLGNPQKAQSMNTLVLPLDMRRGKIEQRILGYSYSHVSAALAQRWLLPQVVVDALQYQAAPFENTAYEPLAGVIHLAAWRVRGREAGLSERELAVTFPGEIGLMLGLDIDMVLQQDPIDWTVRPDAADYLV